MEDNLERILSVDYGTKRIGLALSDPLLTFSYPYKTIPNDQDLFKNLSDIFAEKNIKKIILGYPYSDKGGRTSVTEKILKLKKDLEEKLRTEVILWDESYTSNIAEDMMMESVNKKSKRKDKGIIDRNSAAIILQEYLNQLKK